MTEIKYAERINIDTNFDEAVRQAERLFLEGSVFIYPTDTIYGFGANPFNEESIKKIDEIKRRPRGKMYIMLVNNIEVLMKYIEIKSEKHLDFLLSIWPNPVSVVLPLNSKTGEILKEETAAFRIPNHRFCQKLIGNLQMPLVSTSVNRSSNPPLVEPALIAEEFAAEVGAIFYTDKKCYYEASTLIELSDSVPVLLREGKIKFKDLMEKFEKC